MAKAEYRFGHKIGCRKILHEWEDNHSDDTCRGGWGWRKLDSMPCTCGAEEDRETIAKARTYGHG